MANYDEILERQTAGTPTPICENCGEDIDLYGCGLECSHPVVVAGRMTMGEEYED